MGCRSAFELCLEVKCRLDDYQMKGIAEDVFNKRSYINQAVTDS
jgi:hypothetical protein